MAINRKGKKRLCFNLSRSVNKFYHQISIHPDYRGYLGLAVEREEGHKDFYVFRRLLFGLNDLQRPSAIFNDLQQPSTTFGFNDATRCVTKLLRGSLERGRSWGDRTAEVHTEDGIVFAEGSEYTRQRGMEF